MSNFSEFVLKHDDGRYHAIGLGTSASLGFETVDRVDDISRAQRYATYEFAVNAKQNCGHLRDAPMNVIELRYETVDRGAVPVSDSIGRNRS